MLHAGFCISVQSWENDGDFRHTTLVDGLSAAQVSFYLLFLNRLAAIANNSEITSEELEELHRSTGGSEEEDPWDIVYTFGLWSVEQPGELFIRVLEKIEVYRFPYDIENISHMF